MNHLEVESAAISQDRQAETAGKPERQAPEPEKPPGSPEQVFESARETIEIVEAKKQEFHDDSVEQAAAVLSARNFTPAEWQEALDNTQTTDKLADLDVQADQLAETAKQNIAEKLKAVLVTEQEGFDPARALMRVRKLPREQRRAALAEYKSELAKQKTALAELHVRLEEKIRENPDIEFSVLWQEVRRSDEQHHFSVYQTDTIAEILHTYKDKHAAVGAAAEKFKDDPEGLYELALGSRSKGRVKAEIGPMNIHFVCSDFDDYALAWGSGPADRKKARGSSGVSIADAHEDSLAGTLTFEKNTLLSRLAHGGRARGVAVHEEQHAIHRMFTDVKMRRETLNKSMQKVSSVEEKAALFASYIRTVRWNCLPETKDEVLAYIKGGTGKFETLWTLAHSNLYRHMEAPIMGFELWAKQNAQEYATNAQETIKQVFTAEYRQIMKDGYEAYKDLTKMGKTQAEALALLEHEPLQRWPKVVLRFKEMAGKQAS